jgi:DNA polymerase
MMGIARCDDSAIDPETVMDGRPGLGRREEIARQVRQQLESYLAAGITWMPRGSSALSQLPVDEEGMGRTRTSAVATAGSLFAEAETAPAAREKRLIELRQLEKRVAGCSRCPELAATRTQTVFGTGPIDIDICFVGEAPGADEDRRGEPFVGVAGQLLTRIITAMGMRREDVYICNILKCRPPGNRQPKPDECRNCREYLDQQLELLRPKIICALGATAAQNLLGTGLSIGRLRGKFHEYRGIPVICTYHPASLLPSRSPEKKKDVWEDMKILLNRLGKPIPGTGGNGSSS